MPDPEQILRKRRRAVDEQISNSGTQSDISLSDSKSYIEITTESLPSQIYSSESIITSVEAPSTSRAEDHVILEEASGSNIVEESYLTLASDS